MNDALTSAERRWLEEPDPVLCDRYTCTNEPMPGDVLCGRHADEEHDYESEDGL